MRDGRYVPMEDVAGLAAAVKAIDPERLCTASNAGGDLDPEKAARYVTGGHVDFIAPHRQRDRQTPAGWCFHNGGTRSAKDGRPRRSFDMRHGEGRLFDQLDAEELRFLRLLEQQTPMSERAAAAGSGVK